MGIPWKLQRLFDPLFQDKRCIKMGKGSPYWIYPAHLRDNFLVYSGGVGGELSFELDLQKRFSCRIFLFDPSPTGVETFKREGNKKMIFSKLALSDHSGEIFMGLPKNPAEGSYGYNTERTLSFPCTSIPDFMKKRGHKKIDLLKLDIEGAEYEVLEDLLKNNIQIDQLCLEFHHYFRGISYLKTFKMIQKLRKAGYRLIYKNVDDYTFIKKKLLKQN